jgi:hypothetical protein
MPRKKLPPSVWSVTKMLRIRESATKRPKASHKIEDRKEAADLLNLHTPLRNNYGARDFDGDRVVCHHFRIHLEFGSTICLPSFGDFQGSP